MRAKLVYRGTCGNTPPYLEEVDVPVRVAEAEHVLLLGVLGNGLHDAVLGQQGVARRQLLLWGAFTVGLIEEQSTSWGEKHLETHENVLQVWNNKQRFSRL